MNDHTPHDVFDAHRAEIERQVVTILAARGTELGKRTVLCEVFHHGSGKRLADVIRTTHGPVVVTYRNTDHRITGEVTTLAPLTDDDGHNFPLAEPCPTSTLSAADLRAAITAGRRRTIVIYDDPDAFTLRKLFGFSPAAKPLTKAVVRLGKMRALLRYKRIRDFSAASITQTEEDLRRAEANYERLIAADAEERRRRRTPPNNA